MPTPGPLRTFEDTWCYPSELKHTLKAMNYELRPLTSSFSTGRPQWECIFFGSEQRVLARRLAMALISKAGQPYYVVKRADELRVNDRGPTSDPLDDVYG